MSKKLNQLSKEQLIELIEKSKLNKKYGLVWEEIPEDQKINLLKFHPVLKEHKELALDDSNNKTNYFIEGDNLQALTALQGLYLNKIDIIYIDPPYNTGAKDWKYNNNFVDSEDGYRHSKWINMINSRLILSKDLLKEDGIICMTIDDYEFPRAYFLMEEVFGESNHLGNIVIRNNPSGRSTTKGISITHEYAIIFGKTEKSQVSYLPRNKNQIARYNLEDSKGHYELVNFRKAGAFRSESEKMYFPIFINKDKLSVRIPNLKWDKDNSLWEVLEKPNKNETLFFPIDDKGTERRWRWGVERVIEFQNELVVKKQKNNYQVYIKSYMPNDGVLPNTWWDDKKYSSTAYGTNLLNDIFSSTQVFPYPKSLHAVKDTILFSSPNKNAVVLDFFAGSGTTGHAVLELNKEDGGNRQFILVTNNENNIAEEVTYPRLRNVINGYKNLKNEKIDGLGGNLKYYEIDFVPADNSDPSMYELAINLVDTLCLKENTFTEHHTSKDIKIFKNEEDHYCCIVFDEDKIGQALQKLNNTDGSYSFYIYSLGGETFDEELEDFISEHPNTISTPFPLTMKNIYKSLK